MERSKKDLFFNRELSWLAFNNRVLEMAMNPSFPLLERLRFLSIFASNQDEFFMKRVAYLKNIFEQGESEVGTDAVNPEKLLEDIKEEAIRSSVAIDELYRNELVPALKKENIHLQTYDDLSIEDKNFLKDYFHNNIFPVLTPLAVDPSHPFPFLSNLSTSLGIKLRYPKAEESLFARLKIPETLPQWIPIEGNVKIEGHRFINLAQIIRHNLDELFPNMIIEKIMAFRVTRSAEIERSDDDDADDLLALIEEGLRQRRTGQVIRLEHKGLEREVHDLIVDNLELDESDLYFVQGLLDYTSLQEIVKINRPDLKFKNWVPAIPHDFKDDSSIFKAIAEHDILVHHPYDSFAGSVEKFIRQASMDPNVLAIKMTLYRAGENSSLIPHLIRAVESGKQVVSVIEVKARFDEARNIQWGEVLERAGVHVTYGVVGLKTHAKMALVVRREAGQIRFYCHVGTGNYNHETSKLYTDLGLFTADPEICNEIIETFNFLTGLSLQKNYEKILLAPVNMRNRFVEFIEREIKHAKKGRKTHIIAKMNSLEDSIICKKLYEASEAGVKIDLIVRGFCCIRPGVKGLSENIKVRSILGRFLEHSRLFYFRNGAEDGQDGEFYMGSADWMYRNLSNRVELIIPIESKSAKERLWNFLIFYLEDEKQSWLLNSEGKYTAAKIKDNQKEEVMKRFMVKASKRKMNIRRSQL